MVRMETREVRIEFCWWDLKERYHFGRPRRIWEDNIKIGLQKVGWGGMDWVDLAEDRDRLQALLNAVMNRRIP